MKKRIIATVLFVAMFIAFIPCVSQAADIRSLLNSAPLNPVRNEFYGDKIDSILAECGYGKEDTYTVFKNCYTWLIDNVRYREDDDPYSFMSLVFSIVPDQTYINSQAYSALYQGYGVCNEYAGALYIMAQAIGLKPYYCMGQTRKNGGYSGHVWVELELGGEFYVFDAQVEDNVANGGAVNYYYFGKTLDELGGSHILNEELFTSFKVANGYCYIGEEIGTVYGSDIVTYINGYPINTYVVNDSLYINANALEDYGAELKWNENEKNLNVRLSDRTFRDGGGYDSSVSDGNKIGTVYYSDVSLSVDGQEVNSYNIGDSMLLYLGDLDEFGELYGDADKNAIYFNYGTLLLDQTSMTINAGETASLTVYTTGVSVETGNWNVVKVTGGTETVSTDKGSYQVINLLAVSAGSTELTLTKGNRTAKCEVTVIGTAETQNAVSIRNKNISLKVGEEGQVIVDMNTPIGRNMLAAMQYSASNGNVKIISRSNAGTYAFCTIVAVRPGEARITVSSEDFTDYATVTISDDDGYESGLKYPYNSISANDFSDIDRNSEYYEAIDYLCQHAVLAGFDDGTFRPNDKLKRSEFAAIASRIKGDEYIAATMRGTTKFSDVPAEHWASGYVNYCVAKEMVNGMSDDFYGADSYLTNIQAIKIILSTINYGIVDSQDTWDELEEMFFGMDYWSFYWGWYWDKAYELGIWTDEAIEKDITRAELAQLIYRTLDVKPDSNLNIEHDYSTIRDRIEKPYEFKDSAMERIVRVALQKPIGPIRRYEMANVTDIDASYLKEGQYLESLDDIVNMTGVTSLHIQNQHVTDIEPLVNIKMDDGTYKRWFGRIDLYGNYILDVSPIQKLIDGKIQYSTLTVSFPFQVGSNVVLNQKMFDDYNDKMSKVLGNINTIVSEEMSLNEKWKAVKSLLNN